MRLANRAWLLGALTGIAVVAAIPAIGQDDPKSLLPPGFGDPVQAPDKGANIGQTKPADVASDTIAKTQGPPLAADGNFPSDALGSDVQADSEGLPADVMTLQDLPASVRRTTSQVGILGPTDGDMGAQAFGQENGRYLSYLLRKTPAPIASRWASILLRRALLSRRAPIAEHRNPAIGLGDVPGSQRFLVWP